MDPYKSLESDGFHLRILKEPADVSLMPPSVTLDWSWESGYAPVDWNLENVPIFKKDDPENFKSKSLTSVHGIILEKIILRVIEKHLKDKKSHQSQPAWCHEVKVLLVKIISPFIISEACFGS